MVPESQLYGFQCSQTWFRCSKLAGLPRKIVNLGVTLASNASKYVSFTKAEPGIGEPWGLQP